MIEKIVQSLAIIAGGVWAYRAFVRGRLRWPRASLRHTISHRELGDDRVILRAETVITNSGGVVIRLERGIFRVGQVLPLTSDVTDAAARGELPPPPGGFLQIDWPDLGYRLWYWGKKEIEIEPGESDVIICDFVLPPNLKTVQVYTWFKNVRKRRLRGLLGLSPKPIGWSLTTFYDFVKSGVVQEVKEVETMTGSGQSA